MYLPLMSDYISEFYLDDFPDDPCGEDLYESITFQDLWEWLLDNADVVDSDFYGYVGVSDSVVRERLFDGLVERLQQDCGYDCEYDDIYNLWLRGDIPSFAMSYLRDR